MLTPAGRPAPPRAAVVPSIPESGGTAAVAELTEAVILAADQEASAVRVSATVALTKVALVGSRAK